MLHTRRVFESQAIHGIVSQNVLELEGEQALLLIWGGRSVCVLGFQAHGDSNNELHITITEYLRESRLEDWILDGCFQSLAPTDFDHEKAHIDGLLVTAHNELYILSIDSGKQNSEAVKAPHRLASGPESFLYSAHVVWLIDSRILIAAGTVFGKVLLWSYHPGNDDSNGMGVLSRSFVGHEGSVFGVRISELQHGDSGIEQEQRLIVSCSDDRTIRVWDITEAESPPDGEEVSDIGQVSEEAAFSRSARLATSTNCLAMVMGHASRIWGVRFLGLGNKSWGIISYGEDGTAQIWPLSSKAPRNKANQARAAPGLNLEHQATYSYHSGKNIWGIAECSESPNVAIIATGGADGQIVTYSLDLQGSDPWSNAIDLMVASSDSLPTTQSTLSGQNTRARSVTRIFYGLQGRWNLIRNIVSRSPTYPSGVFKGIASFVSRPPSDKTFLAEYLYSEVGEFITCEGLAMKATRRYVYRYNSDQNNITAWFAKADDGSTVDYLFHDLGFQELIDDRQSRAPEDAGIGVSASGRHRCGEDDYEVRYDFFFSVSMPRTWTMSFNVRGPSKDYTTKATYTYEYPHSTPRSGASMTPINQFAKSTSARAVVTETPKKKRSLQPKRDSFKIYAWLGEKEFLASTEQGNLLVGTMDTKRKPEDGESMTWQRVSQQPLLKTSCIATSISVLGICCLTGWDGTLLLYDHSSGIIEAVHVLHRKAGFLRAHYLSREWNYFLPRASGRTVIGLVATCLGSPTVSILFLCLDRGISVSSVEREFTLELPPEFVVTSSCFVDNKGIIIVGSRSGDLAIYGPYSSSFTSTGRTIPNSFPHVHDHDAVTAIECVLDDPSSVYRSCILTAGRNGRYGIHQIIPNKIDNSGTILDLQTLHTGVLPFGPNIEGICIDGDTLHLWGFRSTKFFVWNETEKTQTMTVDCGGAHRNWAYRHRGDRKGGGSLVYTKASVCYLRSQEQAFYQVVLHGGHGREIKALALSPSSKDGDRERRLLATGAEDTEIRIFDARSNPKNDRCLSMITNHTTGLQKLLWSLDGRLLFSAAGCEEFFVWKVQPAPLITIGVVCEAQCPRVTEEADLRITDFAVLTVPSKPNHWRASNQGESDYLITMVYSDSTIRVFKYSTATRTFALLTLGTYTTSCLTQVSYIHSPRRLFICTASTDGHLVFWPFHRKEQTDGSDPIDVNTLISLNPPTITFNKRIRIHQNSIKSMIAIPISQHSTLIMTGGDDGAIAFTHLLFSIKEETVTHAALRIPKAHVSAVTGVAHLGEMNPVDDDRSGVRHRFVSVGNDRRLKTWVVGVESVCGEGEGVASLAGGGSEGLRVVREKSVRGSVADASCLAVAVERGGGRRVFVAGVGVERWRVRDQEEGLWRGGRDGEEVEWERAL